MFNLIAYRLWDMSFVQQLFKLRPVFFALEIVGVRVPPMAMIAELVNVSQILTDNSAKFRRTLPSLL